MIPNVSWIVPPARRSVGIINSGVEAFFSQNGFDREDGLRLQACIEGVFNYCVGNIRSKGQTLQVNVDLFWKERELRVVVRHTGPGGEWDAYLKREHQESIRRTSFDSMGLFIAREIADGLFFDSQYDLTTGTGYMEYEIVYDLDREKGVF